MTRTLQPPGEPEWPAWIERDGTWDPFDPQKAVCACRWLEVRAEDEGLWGGVQYRLAACVECGVRWERQS